MVLMFTLSLAKTGSGIDHVRTKVSGACAIESNWIDFGGSSWFGIYYLEGVYGFLYY